MRTVNDKVLWKGVLTVGFLLLSACKTLDASRIANDPLPPLETAAALPTTQLVADAEAKLQEVERELSAAGAPLPDDPKLRQDLKSIAILSAVMGKEMERSHDAYFNSAAKLASLCDQPLAENEVNSAKLDKWLILSSAAQFIPPEVDCIFIEKPYGISALQRFYVDGDRKYVVSAENNIFHKTKRDIRVGRSTLDATSLDFIDHLFISYDVTIADLLANRKLEATRTSTTGVIQKIKFVTDRIVPIYKNGSLVERLHLIIQESRRAGGDRDSRAWFVVSELANAVLYRSLPYMKEGDLPFQTERLLRMMRKRDQADMGVRGLIYYRHGQPYLVLGAAELKDFVSYWMSADVWN